MHIVSLKSVFCVWCEMLVVCYFFNETFFWIWFISKNFNFFSFFCFHRELSIRKCFGMSKVSSGEFDGDRRYTCVMCVLLYELYSLIEIIIFQCIFCCMKGWKYYLLLFICMPTSETRFLFSNNASNNIILVKPNTSHIKFLFFFTKLFGNIDNTYVIIHFSSFFFIF